MIDDPYFLATAFAAGLTLGGLYLGTLWFTLQRLHRARHPQLWVLASTACRITLLLSAWYWIAGDRWQGLLACLLGFLVMRFGAVRIARAGPDQKTAS